MSGVELLFLGTGGAWSLPELGCNCFICGEMRKRGERRRRTALALKGAGTLLVDCGPDIASQLQDNGVGRPDAVLITHEHGDHFLGLDELVSFRRTTPKGRFEPIPAYMTSQTLAAVRRRFDYLQGMGVLAFREVKEDEPLNAGAFRVLPFKTHHGTFAAGSVGYVIDAPGENGSRKRLVYTSDFVDLPEPPPELLHPDILVIQSFWLNEPAHNRPNHMSFQKALVYIDRWAPKGRTYLVHIGDGDPVPGDPANAMSKKYAPADPMRTPGGECYPIPRCQEDWQAVVDRIVRDRALSRTIVVAEDGLRVVL